MTDVLQYFIGWDEREVEAYEVCAFSCRGRTKSALHIQPISHRDVRKRNLFDRPWEVHPRTGRLHDKRDGLPMSTQFAFTRFLVPHMAQGWALFTDCDMLWQDDIAKLFALKDDRFAVMVVKHEHHPTNAAKMDGQVQLRYTRKNWSSVMLWNCDHSSNKALTLEYINHKPGNDLHNFRWLKDEEIGELPVQWNYLIGHTKVAGRPSLVHYTDGGPWFDDPAFKEIPYAAAWLDERRRMIRQRESL